jgi:hypothetical protein
MPHFYVKAVEIFIRKEEGFIQGKCNVITVFLGKCKVIRVLLGKCKVIRV